jgi:hypothetical protein
MNTAQPRRMAQRKGDSRPEIRDRLVKAFGRLSLIFQAIGARRTAQQELKSGETRRCEISYEARKRELLVALRQKISEKQTKITTRADD